MVYVALRFLGLFWFDDGSGVWCAVIVVVALILFSMFDVIGGALLIVLLLVPCIWVHLLNACFVYLVRWLVVWLAV